MKEVRITVGYEDNTERIYTIGNFKDADTNIDIGVLTEKVKSINDAWTASDYSGIYAKAGEDGRIGSVGITALQVTQTQETSIPLSNFTFDNATAEQAKATGIKVTFENSGGKTQNKTYNYINPAATDEKLYTLGQSLASLSSDNFGGTTRIDTTKLSAEPEP